MHGARGDLVQRNGKTCAAPRIDSRTFRRPHGTGGDPGRFRAKAPGEWGAHSCAFTPSAASAACRGSAASDPVGNGGGVRVFAR